MNVHSNLFPHFEQNTEMWSSVGHKTGHTHFFVYKFILQGNPLNENSVHFMITVMASKTPVVYAISLLALLTVVTAVPLRIISFNIQNFAAAKLNNVQIRTVIIQVSSSQSSLAV